MHQRVFAEIFDQLHRRGYQGLGGCRGFQMLGTDADDAGLGIDLQRLGDRAGQV